MVLRNRHRHPRSHQRNRIRDTYANSGSCLRIEIAERFFFDLTARTGVRNGGPIRYGRACQSGSNFRHRGFNLFMRLPLCVATVCILNSFSSSNAWPKAPTQTFRTLSKLPMDLNPAPPHKTTPPIEKRPRNPEIASATRAVEILLATEMSALGQKRTSDCHPLMSAIPPKADIAERRLDVRFVPIGDICSHI
jgi:hypothetical protein